MLLFAKSKVTGFRKTNPNQRWGQAFYMYMELFKVEGPDEVFCDRLYNAKDHEAIAMVNARVDPDS